MKTPQILFGALIGALAMLPAAMGAETLASWTMGNGEISDGVLIPSDNGSYDFVLNSTRGVAFGPAAPDSTDPKSLVFDGTMEAPLATEAKVPVAETLTIRLNVKPTGDGDRQTILKCQPYFELRVTPERKRMEIIHWDPTNKKYTTASVACKMDNWNKVEARVLADRVAITVNGRTAEAALKAETSLPGEPRRVEMGCAARKAQNPDNRAFVGAVSEIVITGE